MFLLTSSYDFFSAYLAIEGLSLTLYVLASILREGIISIESAIKYFSLGAISTGIFLFGVSLFFGLIGALDFLDIQLFLGSSNIFIYFFQLKMAISCVLFGFFFKISAFPCHFWVADVYEGIFTPITAFFAIVIKVCILLFFLRLNFNVFFNALFYIQSILVFSSVGSMFIGMFGAIKQVNIKRFIAYASINQVGFIFLGIASCSLLGLISSLMYIIIYCITSLSFFTILLQTENVTNRRSLRYLSDFYYFSLYNNEVGKHLSVTLLSMAGLPPLGGFIGKFFLYLSSVEARLDAVIFISLLISVITTYYYLNIIRYL